MLTINDLRPHMGMRFDILRHQVWIIHKRKSLAVTFHNVSNMMSVIRVAIAYMQLQQVDTFGANIPIIVK